ncbi:MAG: ABC transporter permease [Blastocatellales bacterium]
MQNFIQDLHFGVRILMKRPGFTLIAILTLALGIGANSAIFTVINAVLFKPLPYADESRLFVLHEYRTDDAESRQGLSYLNFRDWREQSKSFESMALATIGSATLQSSGEPQRVDVAIVSADFFRTIGVQPQLGRSFDAGDELAITSEGLTPIMLSHSGWQKHFGGDRNVIGRTIVLDEVTVQIIGVTPPGIIPLAQEPVDFWTTTAVNGNPADSISANGSRNYRLYPGAIARLKRGVSPQQAEAELAAIQKRLQERYPKALTNHAVSMQPLRELFVKDARGVLWLLLAVVGVILLIACVNVANVLLANAAARQREIAIRTALGARQWDIFRQFLTESLLLALTGGAFGILLSMWLVEGLNALLPANLPRLAGLHPDWRVLLFTFSAALLTGILCGLIPAMAATRGNLSNAIKDGGRTATSDAMRGRLRNALVIGEIAMAMTLLVAAGLLLNSLMRLNQVRPGFETGNTLTMQMSLGNARYQDEMENPKRLNNFLSELRRRVTQLPGVTDLAYAQCVPFTGKENNTIFEIMTGANQFSEKPAAQLRFISPEYFRVLNIPVKSGRVFTDRDNPQSAPVMLVNEAFVREYFPDESPIGRKLKLGWGGDAPKEIVGVVGNVRHRSLSDDPRAEMYVPQAQFYNAGVTLIVRSSASPESLVSSIKEQIRALDPSLPLTNIKTLEAWRNEVLAQPRFNTFLLGVFASLAVVLALVGLYGVMSYSVTQRTQEIGVRMALGAQSLDVMRLVVTQGLKLIGSGVLLGLIGALAVTRLLQSWLFGIGASDPATFIIVSLLLGLVALAACWIPARRATKVDPMVALRCE